MFVINYHLYREKKRKTLPILKGKYILKKKLFSFLIDICLQQINRKQKTELFSKKCALRGHRCLNKKK
jgi:hypothetical protein